MRRRTTLLIAPVLGLALLSACSDDGRTLAPTRSGQTTTTTVTPTIGPADAGSGVLRLTTDVVADGGELPLRFTCFGQGLSVSLRWSDVPADATTLAIVVRDRDADGYVHWLVTDVDPTTSQVEEGRLPESAVEQVNSSGAIGWSAPCPPIGADRHIYDISLYALTETVDIDPELPAADAASLIEEASGTKAALALTVTPPAAGIGSTEP